MSIPLQIESLNKCKATSLLVCGADVSIDEFLPDLNIDASIIFGMITGE